MILYQFRKQIENLINSSGLPIDGAYFVIKDVFNELAGLYEQQIKIDAAAAMDEQQTEAQNDMSDAAAKDEDKVD